MNRATSCDLPGFHGMSSSISMKTTIITLFAATLLGFAFLTRNESVNAAGLVAIAFVAGLVAWTVSEYGHTRRLDARLAETLPFALPSGRVHAAPGLNRRAA
jgi:hypothetical protein